MLSITLLAVALTAPMSLAAWGDYCNTNLKAGDPTSNFNGVCVWTSECHGAYGQTGKPIPGACPNDPADVQCCFAPSCMWVRDNLCPGDDTVKCAPTGWCFNFATGECPGGPGFRTPLDPYKDENGQYVRCYEQA
ncbi:uncharacterized protein LOC62_01G000066 [Vanrija pseudolonga]|uniref:Chitin-binding type-2 domain-containing protein n=1 Tax=Vanrija pseudolonga TaxID=143232 RepID=A0AAF0Y1Q2_9TREE|nr:hypothetical protein LOC62_01G000066 [Vanrija pseudolonga]